MVARLLNNNAIESSLIRMMYTVRSLLLFAATIIALAVPDPASAAECFADYKAKKDNPLRLHYGVVELRNGCSKQSAQAEVATRIRDEGWTLLNIVSIFDSSQLSEKKSSAGQFYLRY